MKNNHYLVCSSCLLLLAVIYFICNFHNNNYEILLALLLLINVILSILFWKDGIYKSMIHKFDAIFAKLSFILFACYVLFIKEKCPKYRKIIMLLLACIVLILFYISNKYSQKSWCSKKHIIYHSIFHLFCAISALYVFI